MASCRIEVTARAFQSPSICVEIPSHDREKACFYRSYDAEISPREQGDSRVLSQIFLMNERSTGSRVILFRQGIELLCRTQFACDQQLALSDHVHQFDSGEGYSGGPEGFKTEHRSSLSFDGSVILLDDVVEVFDLAHLNASPGLGVVTLDRRRVGTALVDRNLFGRAFASYRFA